MKLHNSIVKDKARARENAKVRREILQTANPGVDLIRHIDPLINYASAAGFAPIKKEINIWPLLRHLHDQGRRVCLPVVTASATPLTFRRWTPDCEMESDRYGISYPAKGEHVTPQLVLVPLLAFMADGKRLGYGGGYYDRTLAKLRKEGDVFACGVAYAGQEVAELPTDEHDARLDGILTETGFRKF